MPASGVARRSVQTLLMEAQHLALDDTVLVGRSKLLAKVKRAVHDGDQTVLVRWESTKTEQEVAIDDVEKLDFDAKPKRQTRGKRREASGAEVASPARREPQRKRRKKKEADAGAQDPPRAPKVIDEVSQDVREEIERHVKALQSGDADGKKAAV